MEDPTRVGNKGQRVSVATNSFAVTRVPTVIFYQFDGRFYLASLSMTADLVYGR
jgi:hypothetical protein